MIYVTVEAEVRRRPEIVWDVLTDVPALTSWVEGLVEVELDEETPRGVGLAVRVVRKGASSSRPITATSEVTAWREPELLAVETRVGEMLLFDRVKLTATEQGTLLGVYGEIAFGSRVAEFFARPVGLLGAGRDPWMERVQSTYERSVEALVKRVETFSDRPYR